MKLFTAIAAALSAAALFIYAGEANWLGVTWSFIALAWQVAYLIERWQSDQDY